MRSLHTIAAVRGELGEARAKGRSVGFVPTMGALHAGHRSLIERARVDCDVVVVSIFVNPLQFGPNEDLVRYPRPIAADQQLAMNAGTDLLFAPEVTEMFHAPITTSIRVGGITDRLEGAMRPGHFDGVATVVAKLLSIIGSCHAYFGEKDWQQLAVVRRIVADLSIDAIIVGCPTIRDNDGLALSSRNAYLTVDERIAAVSLSAALWHGVKLLNAGERVSAALETEMRARVSPRAVIDYCVAVAADTLEPIEPLRGAIRLLIAARFQSARLIDNMGVTMP